MKLKFIGEDGSMGLRRGNVYTVTIGSLPSEPYIYVQWPVGLHKTYYCPYSSPATLAKNWEVIEDGK